jgi:Fe-S cluster assembly protein SufD
MSTTFTPDASRELSGPDWLVARRAAAAEQLADLAFPTDSEEIWRYSRVNSFDLGRYEPVPIELLGAPGDVKASGGGPVAAEVGERAGLIVVRDGRVVHHELDAKYEARGVRAGGIATAGPDVARYLGRASDSSPDAFTVLHDAFLPGGAYIHVPRGVAVPEPIVVVHWSDGTGLASFPHTLVVAEESAEVTVIERAASSGVEHLVDGVTELIIADNAHVKHLAVQEYGARTWAVQLQRALLGRDASLRSSAIALGGDYARLRSESRLEGTGAESFLTAVYYGDGEQMLDFRTLQDHAAPSTRSELLFKGAVEDKARSVYSGLIHLRPAAQRAAAFQTNRNLVLTEGAGAESIPNLKIEANDVKCSHASTVGPIDEQQLYYLESRGVSPQDAERLVVLGFFEDVFERLPVRALVPSLRRSVADKVGRLHV